MSVNVVKELEELRSMLDTPKKMYTPGSRLERDSVHEEQHRSASMSYSLQTTPTAMQPSQGSPGRAQYGQALNHAERSVDRLGKAIELAEEEMDAALRRTTDVHRSQLRCKESELREMQHLMANKERSVASLRDTLATTKRTYEGRLSQVEGAFALKDAEVIALREELRITRAELEGTMQQARRDSAVTGRELETLRVREAELAASARARGDEAARLATSLRSEREDRRSAMVNAEEMRRHAAVLGEEVAMLKARYEPELEDLQRRLKAERAIRKACEMWLRAELQSREEYDSLLRALRETAASSSAAAGMPGALRGMLATLGGRGHASEVEVLLQRMKEKEGLVSPRDDPASSSHHGGSVHHRGGEASILRGDSDAALRRTEDDNRRLKAELQAAKRLLAETRR